MSQSSNIKAEIIKLLDTSFTHPDIELDKKTIYDVVQHRTNAPRPTIRRVARDVRNELQSKVNILSSQSPAHNKWTDIQRMPYQ